MTSSSTTRQPPATSEQIEVYLRRSSLFGPLPRAARMELAARSRALECPRGTRILERGDPAEHLVLVVSGRLCCWVERSTERAWLSRLLDPGEVGALSPVLLRAPHPCALDALVASRIVLVPARGLRELLDENAGLSRRCSEALAEEAMQSLRCGERLSLQTPMERLAGYIRERVGPDQAGELELAQRLIAAQLGTVREIVGRSLRRLEDDGILVRTGRHVQVLRPDRLAELCG